ncbi:DUF4870 domain-containing protein [soil metagenome]
MTESTPAPAPAAPLSEADDKLWASLAHFGGVLWILPSLIIFLVLKDRGAKTRVEAKEALNFQITFLIVYIALWIIYGILSAVFVGIAVATGAYGLASISQIFFFLPLIAWILNVVFSVLGGIKVQGGGSYRYPFALRLVK